MANSDFDMNTKSEAGVTIDAGLRSYMQKVYNVMTMGLVVTGALAFLVASTPALTSLFLANKIVFWIVALSPLGIIFFGLTPSKVQRMNGSTVTGLFFLMTALIGISMASIFFVYSGASIARVFFITSGTFAATSIYGYTTKRDLAGMGSFMFMGLIGIIIASIVNIFLKSSGLHFAISILGVLIFTGLTAWDTQRIKETYSAAYDRSNLNKLAVMGALRLYLDFINMFQFLLSLLGNRN